MNTQQQSESSMNADESKDVSSELIKRENIKGTPFTLIQQEGHGCFATMGKYQITEKFEQPVEVLNYLENNTYKVILSMILIVTKDRDSLERQANQS